MTSAKTHSNGHVKLAAAVTRGNGATKLALKINTKEISDLEMAKVAYQYLRQVLIDAAIDLRSLDAQSIFDSHNTPMTH